MTTKEYEEKLKRIKYKNKQKEMKLKLKKEEDKYKKKIKFPSTTKLIVLYLFVIFNVVLIFAMYAMWYFADLTYLGVLITDIAAQVLTAFIYMRKSQIENTSTQGFVYEARMKELNQQYQDTTQSSVVLSNNSTDAVG